MPDDSLRDELTLIQALQDTAAALNSTLDFDTLMRRILENIGRVVAHDTANIMLIESGDVARIYLMHGYPEEQHDILRNTAFPVNEMVTFRHMLATRAPLIIPDTDQYPDWQEENWTQPFLRSYAGAPIVLDGDVIGFLNLDSKTANTMQISQTGRLAAFANQAALAIKNARLYKQSQEQAAELSRRNQLLESLNELSYADLNQLEEGEILDTVVRLATEAVEGTSGYVTRWNEADQTTTVLAEYFAPYASQAERASDLGRVYALDDETHVPKDWQQRAYTISTIHDPDLRPSQRRHYEKYGNQIALTIPLWVAQQPIGFLEIWDSRPDRIFTTSQVDLVLSIARQVAESIERAQLHHDLQTSDARTSAMLNALPDMLFRLDRNGDCRDAYMPIDSPYQAADFVGKTLQDTMPPHVYDASLEIIERVLRTGEMELYEYDLPRRNGGRRDFEARIVKGGTDEIIAIVRDVSARKKAEKELAQARDEALAASRVKSQFLANMSHELRTPLNSIINYSDLLINGVYGEVNRTQSDRLERIVRNARNLLLLISDVLDLSKIEAGHMVIHKKRVDTVEFLAGVIEVFRPMAEEKGLSLTYTGANMPPIYVDETRARQVMTNIVGNALKFTHQGGVTLTTETRGEFLCFIVTDTGIGIPEVALDKIFDEFSQADNSSTRRYEGTGLGLTISRRITEMHGGKIEVASQEDVGSIFRIYFPLAIAEAPA